MGGVSHVPTPFAQSLEALRTYTERHVCRPNEEVLTNWSGVSYHAAARNALARDTLGQFTCFLDTDQTFKPTILGDLWRMMQRQEWDVATGVYFQKGAPHMPLMYRKRDDDEGSFEMISGFPKDRPFIIAGAGAGCLLVRNTVFDTIREQMGEGPFDIIPPYSEDLSFCRRLDQLGIELWCDPFVRTNHLRAAEVTEDDHEQAAAGMEVVRHPAMALEVP
jgi:hypothetical protein